MFQKIGETITFNGQPLTITAHLGLGAEAFVYVVNTNQGERVLKVFHQTGKFEKNLATLSKSQLPAPKIYAVDTKNHRVLMQYIRGLPVDVALDEGISLGLDKGDVDEINLNNNKINGPIQNFNRVLDSETGMIYVIDPF